ncbi:DNA-deoxyinosine glycosylase [Permianibacter sp. IMCC34836]|uniref:DNA-deoxyinosine glycosylase n=1 Tax=Permianibacter fluminis TaxID=2738515 RepID=UPI001556CF49|nr:DNA-deoxyinosine glycosylase [Permianibacter fluminis]NQD37055.1 DNA-deoxyinosine glycosylase [Permianibacter fluminis]
MIESFSAIETPHARVLILGTMPGVASLQAQQYYAHPRNAFWPIMATLLEFDVALPYPQRVAALQAGRIAVWDVLASCERPGSLDSAIARASEVPNDFPALFRQCRHLRAVACNGGTAFTLFRRHVLPVVDMTGIALLQLPSTSPAHAGKSLAAKLKAWSSLREYLDD